MFTSVHRLAIVQDPHGVTVHIRNLAVGLKNIPVPNDLQGLIRGLGHIHNI